MRSTLAAVAALLLAAPMHAAVCDGVSEASPGALTTVRVASGLVRPLFVVSPPGDVHRQFLVEQDGRIRIRKDGALLPTPFLDITAIVLSPADMGGGDEEGLLGLAFHPDYATNGWFFVYYTNTSSNNQVVRYHVSGSDPDLADAGSAAPVIEFSHPTNLNHNGGMMEFDPVDGYLYIGTGDGGSFCDPPGNAQNGASYLGKLHRLDVDALPYTIPPDNPFVGVVGFLDEIWAYGLRNPYRWSFDRATADLYIGDVGQGVWEELDWVAGPGGAKGANFGWDRYEGLACPNPSCGSQGSCTIPSYVPPVLQYANNSQPECAITGGFVYRGCRMPDLSGTYLYADYCSARIWSLVMSGGVPTQQTERTAELAPGGGLAINLITSFGEDARGELYVADRGGEIFQIVPVLSRLEVSGIGAEAFRIAANGDFLWEDLTLTSSHPIAEYRVWRTLGNGAGTFDCIRSQSGTTWAGGDPQTPLGGELFSYLVTASNAAGTRTSPGTASDGTPRTLSAAACP